MDNLLVREYDDLDFDSVSKLLLDTFGYEKNKIKSSCAHEFVAELDGVIVGYFILNEMLDVVRGIIIYHVDYVCVSREYRGRGIGKSMMEWAINYSKDNGCVRMELTSGNKRVAAHKLYSSLGFVKRDSAIFRKELV